MATAEPIELRYYPRLAEDTTVFTDDWQLLVAGTTDPISNNVTEAYFDILQGNVSYLSVSLGAGLTWDTDSKTISIQIKNSDLDFIITNMAMTYKLYVVWDYGQAETIKEGAVNAARVA